MVTSDTAGPLYRTWAAEVASGQQAGYESFANERSLPMFQAAAGCIGALMVSLDDCKRLVITIWESAEAFDDFAGTDLYRGTAAALEDSGLLSAVGPTVLSALTDGFMREWAVSVAGQVPHESTR